MLNNYMTEQYMTSILQQYQESSPQKASSRSATPIVENGEQIRRQLNESLFKSIDDSFERQMNQISVDNTRMTDTPMRVQQMVRDPVITSDSFIAPKPVHQTSNGQNFQPMSTRTTTGVQSVRSQYFGQTMPQTRRPQTYRAKVIDYSNGIIEKPRFSTNVMSIPQNTRPLSMHSVLTERNIDPFQKPIRVAQSVSALHSAISSIGQKPVSEPFAVPKPILKNSAQNTSNQLNPELSPHLVQTNTYLISNKINDKTIPKPIPKPKINPLVQPKASQNRDTLVDGFENQGIILTLDLDQNESFYCYYCNTYTKRAEKVEKHCKTDFHKNNMRQTIEDSLNNPLNKRFIFETLKSIGLTAETVFRMELDRIPPENKHFYYVKGIRLKNPGGPDPYHCRFCNQSIQSLSLIESHFRTESHRKNENRTSLSKFLSQTTEPIIGLQYITEYMSPDSLQPVYECSLCHCFEDADSMYRHICSFRHRINLLKQLNPNETILNSIKETLPAVKEIRRRISDLSTTQPTGAIVRLRDLPNMKKYQMQRGKGFEVIDITDDNEEPSKLKTNLSVRVTNERQAKEIDIVIQALKQSIVRYYLNKVPFHMRQEVISELGEDEDIIDISY